MRKILAIFAFLCGSIFVSSVFAGDACKQCDTRYDECIKNGGAILNCQAKRDECLTAHCN
jgi:hypothetical protein